MTRGVAKAHRGGPGNAVTVPVVRRRGKRLQTATTTWSGCGAARRSVAAVACASCMAARGRAEADLMEGGHRGAMAPLTGWTLWNDRTHAY